MVYFGIFFKKLIDLLILFKYLVSQFLLNFGCPYNYKINAKIYLKDDESKSLRN